MSNPIVPLESPRIPRLEKKSNELLLKMRIGRMEINFFQAMSPEQLNQLVEKVLAYDNPAH